MGAQNAFISKNHDNRQSAERTQNFSIALKNIRKFRNVCSYPVAFDLTKCKLLYFARGSLLCIWT